MSIYVKFAEEKKPKTIKQFLNQVFNYKNYNNFVTNISTYSNKECTNLQCSENKIRSFDDILELVQTYYKSATPAKVIKELLLLKPLNRYNTECSLYMTRCHAIKRINLLYSPTSLAIPQQNNYKVITQYNKYDSKYSWGELFNMLGINSQEDFDKFLKK